MNKIGAWLVGARGTLASTAVVGARAIVHGLADGGGLVTELPELSPLPLVGLDQIVFGGWDVGSRTILEQARTLANEDRALPPGLVAAIEDDLKAADLRIRDGYFDNGGPATRALKRTVRGRRPKPTRSRWPGWAPTATRWRAARATVRSIVTGSPAWMAATSVTARSSSPGPKRAVSRDPALTVGLTTYSPPPAGTVKASPGATNVVGTTGSPAAVSSCR